MKENVTFYKVKMELNNETFTVGYIEEVNAEKYPDGIHTETPTSCEDYFMGIEDAEVFRDIMIDRLKELMHWSPEDSIDETAVPQKVC